MAGALTLTVAALFVLLFVAVVVDYLRHRQPLGVDLMLIFGSVAALIGLAVVPLFIGPVPRALSVAAIALLFAQPLFVLRLAARLREVPRPLQVAAVIGYVVTVVPFAVAPTPAPRPLVLAAVGVFAATELAAAAYLWSEARRRGGATPIRMGLAAGATALFGIALLIAGAGPVIGLGTLGADLARLGGVLSAVLYVLAFLPPAPLRRFWQGAAAFRYGQRLLASGGFGPDAVWLELCNVARELTGVDTGAVVLPAPGDAIRVLVPTDVARSADEWPAARLRDLVAEGDRPSQHPIESSHPVARWLGAPAGARYVSTVACPEDQGVLILLSRHQALFVAEDRALIELLAAQAAILAARERLHTEQRHLVERLAAANSAKSDFVAGMSHELRTPLSAILGFSSLMRTEPADGDRRRVPEEWIEHIHNSGEHLLSLINDVLDLAKVEAGRLELRLETFDLGTAIGDTVAGVRPLLERKRLVFESHIRAELINADRSRFRQVLYNLLSNAIKFTPEGGSITVEATAAAGEVRVSVHDTGVGIAPADQQLIFEEFGQVGDPNARREGTGLGLALTRRLVEAHGGRMELQSSPGEGSTFTVVLPSPAPAPSAAGEHAEAVDADERPPVGATVLIIEDDPSAVRLLRAYLEGDGYRVLVAGDGVAGLAMAREEPPAAILLDILLPGMDGWEVLRALKADPALRNIPVIVETIVDERGLGLALGAVDYFLKPIDRQALLERLARFSFTTRARERPVRVLAVDDEPSAVALVEAALRPEGFVVTGASSGHEAVELASRAPFDLVICDLLMPDLDGFGVVSALRRNPATHDVPILILTGHELSDADKLRLNGEILGVVEKGDDAVQGLREWLARVPAAGGRRETVTGASQ